MANSVEIAISRLFGWPADLFIDLREEKGNRYGEENINRLSLPAHSQPGKESTTWACALVRN